MRLTLALLTMLWGLSMSPVYAKRRAPTSLEPVQVGDLTYSWEREKNRLKFDMNIVAKKAGRVVRKERLYRIFYNPFLEKDVQEVYLKALRTDGNKLIVVDEKNQTYSLLLFPYEKVTVWKEHTSEVTLSQTNDLAKFAALWDNKTQIRDNVNTDIKGQTGAGMRYKFQIQFAQKSSTWLFDHKGHVRLLTKQHTPLFQVADPKAFNELLGIER